MASLSDGAELTQGVGVQVDELPFGKSGEGAFTQAEAAETAAVEGLYVVAGRRDHALDHVVLAQIEAHFEGRGAAQAGVKRGDRAGLVDQVDAGQQTRDEGVGGGLGEFGPVDLGHVLLGGGQGVDEGAVVGEEEQTGGVHVQPADALHVAHHQRVGQQAVHAAVVLGLVGALEAGGLEQREVGLFPVDPGLAGDFIGETGCVDGGVRVVHDIATHAHLAEFDELAALAAAAEALSLEETVKFHGGRRGPEGLVGRSGCKNWREGGQKGRILAENVAKGTASAPVLFCHLPADVARARRCLSSATIPGKTVGAQSQFEQRSLHVWLYCMGGYFVGVSAMLNNFGRSSRWFCFALVWSVLLSGCANVAFDHGVSRLDGKALVFGRIVLDREGERLVISPFSMPVVIRDISSADEPRMLAQKFENDGRFYWALPPGRYQVSIVLHNYAGGVVSYSFALERSGRSYYFGDLILHGKKRFDSVGSANMRDIKPEFVNDLQGAKAELLRRNPQLDAASIDRLTVRDMTSPEQRGVAYGEVLSELRPCCVSLASLPYKKLSSGQRGEDTISSNSPVFDFPEGRSRFVAWELSAPSMQNTVALRSVVTPSGLPGTGQFYIFSPAVMLLDENFNVLADLQRGLFVPVPASMMPPRSASLQARIPLNAQTARVRYLVVYTTRSIIEGAWSTSRPGFVPIAGGVLPTGIPIGVVMEPAISGIIEAELSRH